MSQVPLDIRIRPGIDPGKRHKIEDALERMGFEVAGGGGFVDGSESDIMVFVDNVKEELPRIINVLQKAKVGSASVVLEPKSKGVEYPVYSENQNSLSKPWWKFW